MDATIRIKRFDPEKSLKHYFQEYKVSSRDDTTVLDVLNCIKDEIDGTLSFRWSCRMGICGSCGAVVNGKPVLMCATFLKDLEGDVAVVEPMRNFPVIKDLVSAMDDMMDKMRLVMPWTSFAGSRQTERENVMTDGEMERFKQASQCIKCGLCYSACPVYGLNKRFLGPAALALGYRYSEDKRDEVGKQRLENVMSKEGVWSCSFVGECSEVCPKNVDPAIAIQKLKSMGALHAVKSVSKVRSNGRA